MASGIGVASGIRVASGLQLEGRVCSMLTVMLGGLLDIVRGRVRIRVRSSL